MSEPPVAQASLLEADMNSIASGLHLSALGTFVLLGLGCLGTDLYAIATPGGDSPELVAAESVNLTTDLAAAAFLIDQAWRYCTRAALLPVDFDPVKSRSVILPVLALAEAAELLMGFGTPYQGDDLRHGTQQLAALGEQLQGTTPGSSWQGAAAQTYTEQVEADQDAILRILNIDTELADLAQQCADFVTHSRLAIGVLKALLLAGYAVEQMYYFKMEGPTGYVYATAAAVAGFYALGAIGLVFSWYFAQGLHNRAVEIGQDYDEVDKQPSVSAAATTESSAPGPAQRCADRRFFFGTETQAATLFPEATPPPTPQPSPARPGFSVSAPTFASPVRPGQPIPRGHTRPAPSSKHANDPAAPPVDEAQPELEADQQVPLAAAGVSPNQAETHMPTPAS